MLYNVYCCIMAVVPLQRAHSLATSWSHWHLTMKLFSAKCHERATLRKLWRQTGNSSLLPAKCWLPLHVIAGISARFSKFALVLFCHITTHLMTGPLGNNEFCFPWISMFPSTSSRETLRFERNKIHCSPRDQSLSDLLYSKTEQKQNLKTALRFQWSRATAVNISQVTVNCFPFDVIVLAMLPAYGIWRETVSLLDVMWPWNSQWMGAL